MMCRSTRKKRVVVEDDGDDDGYYPVATAGALAIMGIMTQNAETEAFGCPWCGAADERRPCERNENLMEFQVTCFCGVRGPLFKTRAAAIRAWNRVCRAVKKGKRHAE